MQISEPFTDLFAQTILIMIVVINLSQLTRLALVWIMTFIKIHYLLTKTCAASSIAVTNKRPLSKPGYDRQTGTLTLFWYKGNKYQSHI